jgi:hypothetical protein
MVADFPFAIIAEGTKQLGGQEHRNLVQRLKLMTARYRPYLSGPVTYPRLDQAPILRP